MVHAVIVEDDEIVRGLVEQIVSILGWTFDSASNGAQALGIIERVRPDVVISDVAMPTMDGIELLRSLKRTPELSHIPVVLISSVDRESEAREMGCDAFITKPFTIETLLQALPRVLPQQESN